MASRSRSSLLGLLLAGLLFGCAGARTYPQQQPLWVDDDRHPFSEKPEKYFSPFAWDGANQTVFRPISRFFAVDPAGEAVNVNAMDEVPDSSWFQNRIGLFPMSPEQVARGACRQKPLDPAGPWTVTGAKPDGANPGFIIEGPEGDKYLIKFDGTLQGPRATSADVLGSRLYHAAGYYAPCNRVVYFHRSILKIGDDATAEDAKGNEVPVTKADIDKVFSKALRLRDGRYRASSSLFIEGKPIGPWTYQGTRGDDPNDVIAHEDRREVRGMRLLAAWINHFDSREANTLAAWMKAEGGKGYVRHYMIDFGDSLGSLWEPPMLGRRIGHAYYLDIPYLVEDWLTLGTIERPWDRARFGRTGRVFAYFDVHDFDPEMWRPGYPNPAFVRMSERDGAWMARIIARFSSNHVRALIATADLRDELLEEELLRVLWGRRARILRRYLGRLSPLTGPELRVKAGRAELCLEDLMLTTRLVKPEQRHYTHRAWVGRALAARNLGESRPGPDGKACVVLPSASQGDSPGYLIVDFAALTHDNEAQPPARVHLYHLEGARYQVVALERPDDDDPPG